MVVVAIAVVGYIWLHSPPTRVARVSASSPLSTTSSSTTTTTAPTIPAGPFWASRLAAVATWASSREGTVEVSIADLPTGTVIDATPAHAPLRSASIVKVAIAVAVIRTLRYSGRDISSGEQRQLANMIRWSDNDSASSLWDLSGGSTGFERLAAAVGMTATTPDPRGAWGFTLTTAHDQALLLGKLASGALLGPDDTKDVLDLMRNVIDGQRFGLAAAAPAGNRVAVKNGWYEDDDTSTRRVHCLAVFDDGSAPRPVAVAVLTSYRSRLGMSYGENTCEGVGQRLLTPPPPPTSQPTTLPTAPPE